MTMFDRQVRMFSFRMDWIRHWGERRMSCVVRLAALPLHTV